MNRKKIISLLASFLVLMLLFTILSRAADSAGIANVKAETTQSMNIDHRVGGTGKIIQNREQAISTQPEQKIKGIYVNEGQSVNQGDVLFDVEIEYLKEQILFKKQEIEKMDLQQGDLKSKDEITDKKKSEAQVRAAQDYTNAANKGDIAIAKAGEDLQRAQQKLEEFRQKIGKPTGGLNDTVLNELQKACKEKESAYQKAKEELESLGKRIDREVNKALDEAEDKNQEIIDEAGKKQQETPNKTPETDAQPLSEQGTNSKNKLDVVSDSHPTPAVSRSSGESEDMIPETEDLIKVEKKVRDQYKPELEKAQKLVEKTQAEKDAANLALTEYQNSQNTEQEVGDSEQEQQLIDDVTAKQQLYNDAVTAKNDGLLAAERALEDAGSPEGRDSTGKISELDKEKLLMDLKKLETLLENGGQIKSPITGVVTKVSITTGDKTSDGTAILMADTTSGVKFVAQIGIESEKYIAKNDEASIKPTNNDNTLEGLKVASVKANEENKEMLDVTILLPKDSLEIGTAAEFQVTRNSKSYSSCVPIQSVHTENNENFVYVLQESESVLGKEIIAQKLIVQVLDKNEKYAALADGSLTNDQMVITEADKTIGVGSRVRLVEE